MKVYPDSALVQLEFDKIKDLLLQKCRTEYAKAKAADLRIHTRRDFIERELKQTHEFRQLQQNAIYFPNDYVLNLGKELQLLSIEGS
ncbi:MAG: DNA mismatch repair protein MutS, partial [Chitinophagaceae bacterium]